MPALKSLSWWFGVAMAAVGVAAVVLAGGWEFETQLFPIVLGAVMATLATAHTVLGVARSLRTEGPPDDDGDDGGAQGAVSAPLVCFAWIGGLMALIYVYGFAVGVPAFVLLYMPRHGVRWPTALATAALLWAFVELVMGRVMGVSFPDPALWLLFRP